MALLIGIHDIAKSFGAKTLFDGLSFGIEEKERIGLIGPNGAGKTTLLRILEGNMTADTGTISYQRGIRMGILEQVPVLRDDATVREVVLEGLAGHAASMDDWEMEILAEQYMARLALDPAARRARGTWGARGADPQALISTLSGGWKKKVALARELVKQPDILFLDEPTNHLDVESILWLEQFLADAPFATLTVTHDRLFLQRVANRILELDRRNVGGLLSVRGSYADYLAVKEQTMHAQERHETVLRNALRRETEWLRRGPAARTTKQQARIDRAQDLKETVSELASLNQVRVASMDFQGSALPKRLLEVKNIAKSYGARMLFSQFHLRLSPGTRVGLLGMNGAGKSTLIRVLLGQEAPDTGEVFHADQLAVAYFEQNRDTLDPAVSLARTVCPLGEHVDYRGQRVHIKSYLGRFLFTATQMDLPVGKLSGGEQSRILIAKLMLQPANLLVLDEPTNDLDMATLNVLQDCLTEFEGAILLVTHDRYFLDQVANTIIAFPPPQSTAPSTLLSFADLSQWERWFQQQSQVVAENNKPSSITAPIVPGKKKKLSYKDQREFDGMEAVVQAAEARLAALQKECEQPTIASDAARLTQIAKEMEVLKTEIDRLYHRWAELEALSLLA